MRYRAFVTDYDGTVARGGVLDPDVGEALTRLRASGRRLILATGRRLDDLAAVCPALTLFDRVVAENGGLLHDPATGATRLLGESPDEGLVAALRAQGVDPVVVGRVIIATNQHHEAAVRATLRARGSTSAIIRNRTGLMLLPAGVDKASAVAVVLEDLGVPAGAAVGVGDGENDVAFAVVCGYAVAVGDAVPELRACADLVTEAAGPAGVAALALTLLTSEERLVRGSGRRALSPGGAKT